MKSTSHTVVKLVKIMEFNVQYFTQYIVNVYEKKGNMKKLTCFIEYYYFLHDKLKLVQPRNGNFPILPKLVLFIHNLVLVCILKTTLGTTIYD